MSEETPEERIARFHRLTTYPRWLDHGAKVMAPHGRWWVPSIAVEVNGNTAFIDTEEKFAVTHPRKGRLMELGDLRVLLTSPYAR